MKSQILAKVKVADEVWIATALLEHWYSYDTLYREMPFFEP